MKTRRQILCSMAVAPIAIWVADDEKEDLIFRCRLEAGRLSDLMQERCGGQWRVSVDQNLEFILVQKIMT